MKKKMRHYAVIILKGEVRKMGRWTHGDKGEKWSDYRPPLVEEVGETIEGEVIKKDKPHDKELRFLLKRIKMPPDIKLEPPPKDEEPSLSSFGFPKKPHPQ